MDTRILWLTQLKALFKSQKMTPNISLLFKAVKILLFSLYMALSVADLVLKPNSSYAKILFLLLCSQISIRTAFSSTLEKEVKTDIGI